MPLPLPDRYRLEVRLGRDDDIEQWLATDDSLNRPVLVRILGPETDSGRRAQFLESVRAAAVVNHAHMASVYHAEEIADGAYSISEWTAGVTLGDRLDAGDTIGVDEFLPNAAGLADALAALHAEGHLHGAIDPQAVFHTVAHPAQLGAFGRIAVDHTPTDDVRSLAAVLEMGLTGSPPGGPPPSEIVDGLDRAVDHALRTAQLGHFTARQFADMLRAAPSPVPPPSMSAVGSRRFLIAVAILVVAGLLLIGVGRVFGDDGDSPPLFPSTTAVSDTIALPQTTTSTTTRVIATPTTIPLAELEITSIRTVDPFGGGDENDDRVTAAIDGDPSTVWRTERYRDPLPLLKPGVGFALQTGTSPAEIVIVGMNRGTAYEIAWSPGEPDPSTWEVLSRGRVDAGTPRHQLPERVGGWWIVWFSPSNPRASTRSTGTAPPVRAGSTSI
ncbi:MAG: hypothetical protein R3246_11010, partial [Acidimicrobiia bacterium]|nr:hypothetical protein [Acidimicrobiia bacterium]